MLFVSKLVLYGAVPPETTIVIVPSSLPKQISFSVVATIVNTSGSEMVKSKVSKQPLAS